MSKTPTKAVLFDFGQVFTIEPNQAVFEEIAKELGIDQHVFESRYFKERPLYDQGIISDSEYWRRISHRSDLNVDKLVELDCKIWFRLNQNTLDAWNMLGERGVRLGLLSNMPKSPSLFFLEKCEFLSRSKHLFFSCNMLLIKPMKEIFIEFLNHWDFAADQTLFIDDNQENVNMAQSLGFKTLHYTPRFDLLSYIENQLQRGEIEPS